jgi:predicted metal-dependent HD superfamily phosphohydrolase
MVACKTNQLTYTAAEYDLLVSLFEEVLKYFAIPNHLQVIQRLGLVEDLLKCYSEPQRHYHTTQHLFECLNLFKEYNDSNKTGVQERLKISLALCYHDVVYKPLNKNNERKSSEYFTEHFQNTILPLCFDHTVVLAWIKFCKGVKTLIRKSDHKTEPRTLSEKITRDIDLAIIGADPDRYVEYERQVREEYFHIPYSRFIDARADALRKLFKSDKTLYHTEFFRARNKIAESNTAWIWR